MSGLESAYLLSEEIARLKKEVREKEAVLKAMLTSRYDEGITVEGNYEIERKVKTNRRLDVKRFALEFPKEFAEIAEVPLAKAEALVGTARVNLLCNLVEQASLKVVFRKETIMEQLAALKGEVV